MRFSELDREKIERLEYDPASEPSYELVKSHLVWPDEEPTAVSEAAYDLLCILWFIRGLMHRHVPPAHWGPDAAALQNAWQDALREIPRWPGFKRLELSEADRAFLDRCTREERELE
ncbi:hypothetical protein [Chondromyces crocatus]|uniref:Uncharacterized protein n=1 Tax=Chondromyces crocatus TaxID=52 RepID=A0A0K1EAG5_CHOCO|nr:hypothetical protein [Chondromyces crocatus]AKT37849.1 uncharacterized protein CMC5_019920 [Chondromyces crocatus]